MSDAKQLRYDDLLDEALARIGEVVRALRAQSLAGP